VDVHVVGDWKKSFEQTINVYNLAWIKDLDFQENCEDNDLVAMKSLN